MATGRLVALAQRYVPDQVTGLHLIGSAIDGDFQPGRSDLDFVAVLSRPANVADLAALAILHRTYATDPTMPALDGIWITVEELAAGPDGLPDGPTSSDNRFFELARGNRNPVTWAMLPRARTVIGQLDRAALRPDPVRLKNWVRENARSYWTRWHTRASQLWSPHGLASLGPSAAMWGVLGISRLHYTMVTGDIASKTAAGEHALGWIEPRWHPIVNESLRIRRSGGTGLYASPFKRRQDALDFVAMMIGEIRRL
ncbi:aminoglycoside adenylyltransferase domain-containing protein [Devosia sp.]|uniref:aminoglycoside adenylyltransferase domain-containing protein n=1 Tax=Devosia sp. TaxID=1871048 RepID=UPI00260CAC05|nr:aminoglycoside adenylyltransferase domain-containing protein [Devosia sp.]